MKTIEHAREDLLQKLNGYAASRKLDVQRGLETPELAGLLIQKYGYGLCDAFTEIFNENRVDGLTYKDVDQAVEGVDPNWRITQDKRWKAIAGLDVSKMRATVSG